MSFIKVGDESPIIDYFDDNGKEQFCAKCGKKLVLIAIDNEDNKFVCKDCDISESDKSLKS